MTSSVRMAFEGRSTASGEQPRWLKRAMDIRVLGFSDHRGNTMLELEAQRLGDAADEIYKQRRLCSDLPGPEETALNVMVRVVHDIRMANAESPVYDSALLRVTQRLDSLFVRDLRAIRLPETPSDTQLREVLDRDVPTHAKQLCNSTPPPRQIRLAGTLDMIRYSTRAFALKLADGKEIRGVLDRPEMVEGLSKFLNKNVVVVGKAIYRPSGSVLRIDAQHLEESSGEAAMFSRVPPPLSRRPATGRSRMESSKAGVAAFFGTWPGDETDEELLAALKDMRG